MEGAFRYRSQVITDAQVEFVRQLITQHPGATRRRLSLLLCEAWDWKQANGAPSIELADQIDWRRSPANRYVVETR